jgi:hypothetical protein
MTREGWDRETLYPMSKAERDEMVRCAIEDAEYEEKPFIPAGHCPKHHGVISNGMFDGLCGLCEHEIAIQEMEDAR